MQMSDAFIAIYRKLYPTQIESSPKLSMESSLKWAANSIPQNNFHQIKNWNNVLYLIRTQSNKSKNQQKEKLQKLHKYIDTEEYTQVKKEK